MLSRADCHVHTKYSGLGEYGILRFPESISNPEDVVKIARQAGISVLCITDHNATLGAFKAQEYAKQFDDIEVIIGEEITTLQGEIIGLFLKEQIPMGLSLKETIARIREQGGLVVAPHPFSYHVPAIGSQIFEQDVDAIEVINGGHIDGPSNDKAMDAAKCGRWALTAGSDAHSLSQLGCAYTLFEGKSAEDFRKAILNKTTTVKGQPFPMRLGVSWSIGIVLESDKLMLKSLLGMLEGDEDDIIVKKIKVLSADKKIVALFGSMIYFTPPIPFLAAMASKAIMRKKEERASKIEAMHKRRLRSKVQKNQ